VRPSSARISADPNAADWNDGAGCLNDVSSVPASAHTDDRNPAANAHCGRCTGHDEITPPVEPRATESNANSLVSPAFHGDAVATADTATDDARSNTDLSTQVTATAEPCRV
jgi:hypothetical protein